MRKHRGLTTGLALGLLLTTAASTTYAQTPGLQDTSQNSSIICRLLPRLAWCHKGPVPDPLPTPAPSATPELDSLLLFGAGLTGLGGYAVTRYRARRRT